MTISEKVAYLKGLAEGMQIDTETKEESCFPPSLIFWRIWL